MEELKEAINIESIGKESITSIDETKNSLEALKEIPSESTGSTKSSKTTRSAESGELSESVEIKTEDANTTNCLALTIQEDHKLVALKNVFLRSIRMSWKVVVSAITLSLIKLFS